MVLIILIDEPSYIFSLSAFWGNVCTPFANPKNKILIHEIDMSLYYSEC